MNDIDWSDHKNVFWKWDIDRYTRMKELYDKACINNWEILKAFTKQRVNEIADKWPTAKLTRID